MKCGHLFNGIGGFALAAHWMGWKNVMHCEIDPFCNRVMVYHFPNSIQHEDIRTTDFSIYRGKLDLLTGGWPCQPVSTAGKRKGKNDVRYLWPEMLRAIRQIQPGWIVGENVRGLTNWQGGILFDEVQADLEAECYEVLPFLLPAAGVNAPHTRFRIFFVAYSNRELPGHRHNGAIKTIWSKEKEAERIGVSIPDFINWPTQSSIYRRNDGVSQRLDGITLSKWREASIEAYGNAIVPQVALQIFKAIEAYAQPPLTPNP